MGSAQSSEEAALGLDTFDDDEQRLLLRNFALLASHDAGASTTFTVDDYASTMLGAMPPPLARALFHGMDRAGAGAMNCDTAVAAVAAARAGGPSSRFALGLLHAAVEPSAAPTSFVDELERVLADATCWLATTGAAAASSAATDRLPTPPPAAV
eukprot:3144737-Prymnesium_polylepis.1